MILSPSLLSSNFGRLTEELAALEEAGISWVHWDVMDGSFVPNITMGAPIINNLRAQSKLFFDVHLMIERPELHIDSFVKAGANMLVVHCEATTHLHRTITAIQATGIKAGVALNPSTHPTAVEYVLDYVDMVLIMSVNPGFGGQKFIPSTYNKIAAIKEMCLKRGVSPHIQVDGGVTLENTKALTDAGANVLVAGTAFFSSSNYKTRLEEFTLACQKTAK